MGLVRVGAFKGCTRLSAFARLQLGSIANQRQFAPLDYSRFMLDSHDIGVIRSAKVGPRGSGLPQAILRSFFTDWDTKLRALWKTPDFSA